ncbi:MAG: cupin domain-containing protein [Planctomycetota bacterium]|nr:cupin domain-containing protein [Planctomycetota bacterium]
MSQAGDPKPRVMDWTGGKAYLPLLEGPPATCGMRSGRVELKAGEEIGEHSTGDHEEVLVMIEGEGEVRVEGHPPLAVRGGQAVYIPPQSRHNVRNAGAPLLRYIYIVAPTRRAEAP